ncbi:MAG: hypothetical protein KKA73_11195 [Chloroflexi bacterium]|nr:hypothetical protein [Chloroflexota bacterium]
MFSITRKARYVWDSADHRFVSDPTRSELSPQEIALIDMDFFQCSNCGPEEFLRRNLEELVHLAIAGKLSEKEWLTQFLSEQMTYMSGKLVEIEDTPEKRALLAILNAMP